jgi:hypothetical protein
MFRINVICSIHQTEHDFLFFSLLFIQKKGSKRKTSILSVNKSEWWEHGNWGPRNFRPALWARAQIPLNNDDKKILFMRSLVGLFHDAEQNDRMPSRTTECRAERRSVEHSDVVLRRTAWCWADCFAPYYKCCNLMR